MKSKTKPIYYVIDSDGINFTPAMRPAGPFSSIAAAEDHLVADALIALHSDDCDPVRAADCVSWAAPAHIVKVVKTVRQVPVYDVSVKLVKIKTETLKH